MLSVISSYCLLLYTFFTWIIYYQPFLRENDHYYIITIGKCSQTNEATTLHSSFAVCGDHCITSDELV